MAESLFEDRSAGVRQAVLSGDPRKRWWEKATKLNLLAAPDSFRWLNTKQNTLLKHRKRWQRG
ncbi:MAG: hypothetical protein DRH76_10250 [Deltaproteobacteria bacterium]|nr:MAG: hypothetical protein DRH76_10250 [Deltaproteobacteria bacterium]